MAAHAEFSKLVFLVSLANVKIGECGCGKFLEKSVIC